MVSTQMRRWQILRNRINPGRPASVRALFYLLGATLLSAGPSPAAPAQPGPDDQVALSMTNQIIVSGIRLILDQTLERVDFQAAKRKAIKKINKKDPAAYGRTMNRIFADLEALQIKNTLGLTRKSTKKQTIQALQKLEPETLQQIANGIPDPVLAQWVEMKVREQGLESLSETSSYISQRVDEIKTELFQ